MGQTDRRTDTVPFHVNPAPHTMWTVPVMVLALFMEVLAGYMASLVHELQTVAFYISDAHV